MPDPNAPNLGEDADLPPVQGGAIQPAKSLKEARGRKTLTLVDLDGVPHQLPALRFRDLEEIEELCEGFDRFYDSRHKIRNANFVLWLAARNEGLTKAQRLAHAWARTREEVDDLFGGSNSDLMRLATEIMNMSGFDMHVRSAEGSEPSPLAATGGALSPPASPSDSATTPSTT